MRIEFATTIPIVSYPMTTLAFFKLLSIFLNLSILIFKYLKFFLDKNKYLFFFSVGCGLIIKLLWDGKVLIIFLINFSTISLSDINFFLIFKSLFEDKNKIVFL